MFLIALAVLAAVRITTPLDETGQMEVLRRGEGEWVRSATVKHERESELASSSESRAVLIRYPGRATYWFAEVAGGAEGAIAASEFRDVVVSGAGEEPRTFLYLASEDAPREANGHRFERVPVESGIACGSSTRLPPLYARSVRPRSRCPIRRVNEGSGGRLFPSLRSSASSAPVRSTATSSQEASMPIAVHGPAASTFAGMSRGRSATLPGARTLNASSCCGVPWNMRKLECGSSPTAICVASEATRAASPTFRERAAASFAEADPNGEFQLPQLGSGPYMAKLLSAVTTSALVKITAGAGARTDVSFPAGPRVRGRAVRTSGGSPTDPVIVELSLQLTLDEVMGVDVLDFVRTGTAAADGSFELVLPSPGAYRLRARWGAASAERQFTFTESMRGVELGELELVRGTGVHGVLPGCMEGEAILMAVPDVSKPLTVGFNMTRRAPIANGRFYAGGIVPGLWTALLKCGGTTAHVTPETFVVTGEADVVIEFASAP